MKTIKKILLAIALTPVVAVLAPIAIVIFLPFMIVYGIKSGLGLMIFKRREAGRCYLICTSKRRWYDFLNNNVVPALPPNTRVVWHKPGGRNTEDMIFTQLRRSNHFAVSKPYLVLVTKRKLQVRTINDRLQHLKPFARVSEEIRSACVSIIQDTIEELRTNPSSLLGQRVTPAAGAPGAPVDPNAHG